MNHTSKLMALLFITTTVLAADQLPQTQLLNNGDMEQTASAGVPGWSLDKQTPKGVLITIDKVEKHGGESAMKVVIPQEGADKTIKIQQELKGALKSDLRFGGFWKADGDIKEIRIAMQCFDEKWKQVGWLNIGYASKVTGKWTPCGKELKLPEATKHAVFLLLIYASGPASVWYDDLSITPME